MSKTVGYDCRSQVIHETWYFENGVTGTVHTVPLILRMFFPQEIDALLHYNGFQVESKYGDYDESPFDSSSRRQIIACTAM